MKKLMKILLTATALCTCVAVLGCKTIDRVDEKKVIDVSGRWNDTDARLVAEEMTRDSLSHSWSMHFDARQQRHPVVVIGTVHNNTAENINSQVFTKELERAFVNSGHIKVVAGPAERGDLREEVRAMRGNVRPETLKRLQQETGADFYLMGFINDIVDEEKGEKVQFYQINLELIDLVSHEKVWIGQQDVKKHIQQKKFGIF